MDRTNMPDEYWLDDKAWAAIEPLLPKVYAGARRHDDRRIISGIVHVLRSGCCWKDWPAVYGPHTTVYNRFNRWSGRGRWQGIFDALVGDVPTTHDPSTAPRSRFSAQPLAEKAERESRRSAAPVVAERQKSTVSLTVRGDCSALA
jgi:putative transposase